ncbi:PPC domain-containing protein [Myxococcota bacterium]|nr:PPC domain-containing protein [Myxococcota bacterium]
MPRIDQNKLNAFKAYKPEGAGVKALDNAEKAKPVDNNISLISFFVDGVGGAKPFLTVKPSPVEDPGRLAKILDATPEKLNGMKGKPEEFSKFLTETVQAKQGYFKPVFGQLEGAPTRFKYNNIVGQRVKAFVDEARKLADELYANDPAQKTKAYYAANTAAFDLLAREILFDDFEIEGYASFGHDAAFIHAWELRLKELEKVDTNLLSPEQKTGLDREKKQIQNELDAIFREKYVYNNSAMFETNAEVSVGLCLIDVNTRQRVSETEGSRDTIVPKFEILNLTVNGQDRPVYFDAKEKKYYFDKSDEVVPQDQVANIRRRALNDTEQSQMTFRRAMPGEHLRENFRHDWNGDGYVQNTVIDWVSWAGHCNDKSNLESHGLVLPRDNQGVYEYNSASGSTARYDRNLLNEKLMSFSELDTWMKRPQAGAQASKNLSVDQFAGARDDDRPDRLHLGVANLPYGERPNEFSITKVVKDGKTYDGNTAFSEYIVAADKKSATKNPLYKNTIEGDRVQLDLAGAAIHAAVKYQVFDDSSGYPSMVSKNVVIDFANPPAEPVLVDSVMQDAGKREMYEISLDIKNKTWVAQLVRMEKKADGRGYERKVQGEPIKRPFDPAKLTGSHETNLDNPSLFFDFVKEALTTGKNFTSETADGAGVWNGRTKRLKEAKVWRDDDTKWAKVDLAVDARYGAGEGSFLVKLKDNGEPDYFVPLAMAFDFAWRTDVAFAPEKDGLVNAKAFDRGIVSVAGGRVYADAVSNMLELLHCAFNARPYVILHEGQRYFFETKEQWEAEKAKLDQLRAGVIGGEPGPAPIGIGKLVDDAGRLAKGGLKQHEVVAEADGPITIKLLTNTGDADLYVKKGGAATNRDHTLKSVESDLKGDTITIDAKKGEKYGIAVYGYKESDYKLEVTGPKAGAVEPPINTAIDFHTNGVVAKGEKVPFRIEVKADGELDLKMSGSGDADLYLKIGGEPTTANGGFDFRLYGDSSNEAGKFRVKKGDVVHGFVHGYADRSEFDLRIKS